MENLTGYVGIDRQRDNERRGDAIVPPWRSISLATFNRPRRSQREQATSSASSLPAISHKGDRAAAAQANFQYDLRRRDQLLAVAAGFERFADRLELRGPHVGTGRSSGVHERHEGGHRRVALGWCFRPERVRPAPRRVALRPATPFFAQGRRREDAPPVMRSLAVHWKGDCRVLPLRLRP
jgi:hypothetical protein